MSTAVKVALGVFIGGTLLVAACSALVAGGGRGDDNRDPVRGIEPSALYNSVAVTFTRRLEPASDNLQEASAHASSGEVLQLEVPTG